MTSTNKSKSKYHIFYHIQLSIHEDKKINREFGDGLYFAPLNQPEFNLEWKERGIKLGGYFEFEIKIPKSMVTDKILKNKKKKILFTDRKTFNKVDLKQELIMELYNIGYVGIYNNEDKNEGFLWEIPKSIIITLRSITETKKIKM